jgi:NTP pyrophosphatase (non-canonical NTP hydrolase)
LKENAVINDYAKFVDTTTSEASKNTYFLTNRLDRLCGTTGHKGEDRWEEMQVARLLTAVVGMMAESGEFAEVVKKKVFQADTQFTDEEIFHMKRELGDVLWYWVQGCMALGFTPEEVMKENIKKLEARYPNGFEVIRSENRVEGDI